MLFKNYNLKDQNVLWKQTNINDKLYVTHKRKISIIRNY